MRADTIPVPVAEDAEVHLAGCAAHSARGARLAAERVQSDDFWEPRCRRVMQYITDPRLSEAELAAQPGDKLDARLAALAGLASVDVAWLRTVVDERPTMTDESGELACQVKRAALRRQVMSLAAEAHQAAAEGRLTALWGATGQIMSAVTTLCALSKEDVQSGALPW